MRNAPLIAVTTSEVRTAGDVHQTPQGDPPRTEMALALSYVQAIEHAGGIPVVVTPLKAAAIAPLLDHVGGLLISGGPDLEPAAYGADPHPKLGPTEPEIDLFELALIRAAERRRLPVLALCRGAQVINVARGGTLHQHLPDLDVRADHRQTTPGTETVHEVELESGSLIAEVMGAEHVEVNSFHHQAIDKVGRGLRVTGRCEDGIVEVVEAPRREFFLGVQWHAESLTARPEHLALFEGLVDAARRHRMSDGASRAA
ncbi:MAG: gamma-glutamyl-gamma-aminobutyrate hydrolase family protein [Thermoleophilaceae bacterium]|nr:gamma-glutamyl-gamma-aminobutyrate hydrolase family protein [Thermoleophilaceae bacterium]